MPPELLISGGNHGPRAGAGRAGQASGLPTQYAGLASIVAAGLVLGLVQLQANAAVRGRRRLAAALARLRAGRGRLLQPGAQAVGRTVDESMDRLAAYRGVPPAIDDRMRRAIGGRAAIGWRRRSTKLASILEIPCTSCGELLVAGRFEIAEIVRQEQKVIELTGGSLGNRQEPCQFGIAIAAAPFGDVRRDRCGSPSQLVRQPVPFLLREGARLTVHLQRQLVGSLPHPQIAKVPHLAPRTKTPTALGDRSVDWWPAVCGQSSIGRKPRATSADGERPLAARRRAGSEQTRHAEQRHRAQRRQPSTSCPAATRRACASGSR